MLLVMAASGSIHPGRYERIGAGASDRVRTGRVDRSTRVVTNMSAPTSIDTRALEDSARRHGLSGSIDAGRDEHVGADASDRVRTVRVVTPLSGSIYALAP